MQRQGYAFNEFSNITTWYVPAAAKPTTPLHPERKERLTPRIILPNMPVIDVRTEDFIWRCELGEGDARCPRGWSGDADGQFWPPAYVVTYTDSTRTAIADVRYGCCRSHANEIRRIEGRRLMGMESH